MRRDALVGTGQRPPDPISDDDPLSRFIAHLPAADRTAQLLLSVGIHELFLETGRRPLTLPTDRLWTVAPDDQRALCTPEVAKLLEEILNGHFREMLGQFLSRLHRSGQRLPAYLLPNLLSYGGRIHRHQTAIIDVIGGRGRWLASLNDKWSFATLDINNWDDLLRRWHSGKLTDRSRLLSQVRTINPTVGLQLLESSWGSEANSSRLHFMRQLDVGLSMDDEPFLERVLDDRHQPIRQQAGRLLSQLPDSRYAHRMSDALTRVIRWHPRRLGERGLLKVALPKASSPEMRRDGIPPLTNQRPNLYIKQQLTKIVSAASLETWCDHWQVTPEEVIEAVVASGWTQTLLMGLSTAARQQWGRSSAWLLPIAQASNYSRPSLRLIPLLPEPERQETVALIIEQFRDDPLKSNLPLKALLRDWPYMWSISATETLGEVFARFISEQENAPTLDLSMRAVFMQFIRRVPPELDDRVDDVLRPAVEKTPLWRGEVADGIALLRFRKRLEDAFATT